MTSMSMTKIVLVTTLFSIYSCIEAPKAKRSVKAANTTTTTTSTNLPTFTNGNNFFQNGGTTFTGTFTLDIDFADTYYFRGKEVDSYIRNSNNSTPVCMVARFQASTVNKIILLAMMPRSTYNYTNQSIEYYYSLSPSDETTNKNYCQKTSLINKLFSLYPTLTPYYKIKSLCSSGVCATNGYTSEQVGIYANSGTQVSSISTTSLIYFIKNTTTNTTTTGSTCTSNAECTTQGYDCCSGNQCVKDLQKKTGFDENSNDYKQALQDILNNPSAIYNYPQYYFICSKPVNQPTSGSTTTDSDAVIAQRRIDKLASYYNCVNKVHGEYGICTVRYSGAKADGTTQYFAGVDDRSFATTFTNIDVDTNSLVSIEKVYYGDVLIYDYSTKSDTDRAASIYSDSYLTINGNHNDDLTTGAGITLNSVPAGASGSELVIQYKVDASCTYINDTTSKCEKYYTQGQRTRSTDPIFMRVTDHYVASNIFKLPAYANVTKTIKVEIDGVLAIEGIDWNVVSGSPSYIELIPSGSSSFRAQDDQIVKITFFSTLAPMASKKIALDAIKATCSCSDYSCNLAPVKSNTGAVTDYICVYPENNPTTIPLSQKLYLSSKTVPMRYYDNAGLAQNSITSDVTAQEGLPFSYTNNDLSKPNNLNGYVGFNEIYGSLSYGTNSAKAPKVVDVKKGSSYDIYVDNGSFYSCSQCGTDYYSQINKIFPSFQYGGGLSPMQFQSNRIASNSNVTRWDEFQFGRACFVPATMIPWTHYISSNLQTQRKNRLYAQHFLFANGYQRDWYGFDYGAVIGSFDGVKWFAIGTNRRIKATSNKLFIAVNAYAGDLTIESTYNVSINDATLNPSGAGMISTDVDNDGAECQRYHQCNKDQDCAARLGPDYTCSSVTEITTSWPLFDDNGKEIADSTSSVKQLTSILGISNPGKRCVYRGRGALCTQNYGSVNTNSTFNQTSVYDFHACAPNYYCQSFAGATSLNANFNNRISRYGKVITDSTKDTFGLGAPVPLRPFSFNGEEEIRTEAIHNLNANKAVAMCIPGKMPEKDTFTDLNKTEPDKTNFPGDRVVGIGQTKATLTGGAGYSDPNYLASCGILDTNGNYFYKSVSSPSSSISGNSELVNSAGAQATSTNSLYLFKTLFQNKGLSFNLLSSPSSRLTGVTFQQNTCLRPAGASCATDLECAPSKAITDKTKLVSASDSSVTSLLNQYEVLYWQEPLVCSQAAAKTAATYDPRDNKCCREIGNTISIGQKTSDTNAAGYSLETTKVPGLDLPLNSRYRYSRVSTYYKEYKDNASTYPALEIPKVDQCSTTTLTDGTGCLTSSKLTNQFNTINLIGSKTSCSNGWIRNFANGTHIWSVNKLQTFNTLAFRCYNWAPNSTGNWTCAGMDDGDPECTIIQTFKTSPKAKAVLSFLGKLELTGIPQVKIPTEDQYMTAAEGDLSCRSFPTNQKAPYPGDNAGTTTNYLPSTFFWANFTDGDTQSNGTTTYSTADADFKKREIFDGTNQYYSALDMSNFNSNFKQVFKPDEIVACAPAGTVMSSASDSNKCCSGFINQTNMKCALPDFVDISVYTNKYVSSEASSLNASLFDEDGYIKDPSMVAQLACSKSMCASGKIAYGVLVSNLKIPGLENSSTKFFRFLQSSTQADDANGLLTLFNQGLKLNNHAYCMPNTNSGGSSGDLTVITCN